MDGANANYVFEGAGSALSDGSAFFKKIGAVVYSYNPREVNIWYPGSEDYLLFVGWKFYPSICNSECICEGY